ncbi:TonB-dependent receptor [Ferruginibacter sp. HRS2-29]|uniref:TonB-dependent receptor n=1 Tax=Ferruginibacter sp. HRS2-29 TaxID=2487334 RepID=UPI0020CBBCBA|nr:TonB-dependent receptor [Ferruginibacter sp. HRS2-29]
MYLIEPFKCFKKRRILILICCSLLLLISDHLHAQVSKAGLLAGTIKDENNLSLAGVTVEIISLHKTSLSSVSGEFALALPEGSYTVNISFVGFEKKAVTDVIIKAGSETVLPIILNHKKSNDLTDIVVTSSLKKETASGLLRVQKNSITVSDGISAELMKRTPDNNIGQSLARVSGVNVQGGKFVTIRGVSDRYNNVQINGSTLPSSEPNRRNFSFDIIPSSLVDNVVVYKTASPDLPGEFTGGLVQVNTKDVPSKNFIEINIGTGFNTESAGKEFVGFQRDKQAHLAKVDDNRLWFGKGRAFDAFRFFKAAYSLPADTMAMRAATRSIPNRWQFYKYAYTPVHNYQVNGGLAKRFKNSNSLGVIAALTYRNDQLYEEGEARNPTNYDVHTKRYKYNTTIGGILNASYKTKKHRVAWKNLFNKKYSNQVDDRTGLNESAARADERRFADVTLQSRLFQSRLEGEHALTTGGLKIDWYADDITFKREQPDSRYLLNTDLSTGAYSYDFKELQLIGGGLFSSQFKEKRNNAGANISIPFLFKKEKEILKMGYAYSRRKADFANTGLRILARGREPNLNPKYGYTPYYLLVTPEGLEQGDFYYNPAYATSTSTGDAYTGIQELNSFYAMLDLKVFKKLRLTGGIRNENNSMNITTAKYSTVDSSSASVDTTNSFREKNWLPSLNVIYSLGNKINIRAAFSKTLSRPDFVERTYVRYYDFADQVLIRGNEGLKLTTVKNYDLRFEYYPAGGEVLSFSLFYKDFKNAVERDFQVDNPSSFVEYTNKPRADAKGFEVDIRKSMGFINGASKILERCTVSFNYTYLKGTVKTGDTSLPGQNRPIQGLAPFLLNAGLYYDQPRWGVSVSFNRSGRKIINAGRESAYLTQYEKPRSILDLQLNAKFFKEKMIARFNIGDLLNQPFIIYSNIDKGGNVYDDPKGDRFNAATDFVNYQVKPGVNYSLSVSYKF